MKRAVSVSLGSSRRDGSAEIQLLGQAVRLERIGVDGDLRRAAGLLGELDGRVDALGLGGADLGLMVDGRWYPLHSVERVVRPVRRTPLVDGTGLKMTLERRVAAFLDRSIPGGPGVRRVLVTDAADRWGMAAGFAAAGWDCVFGDLMFGLGVPLPVRSPTGLKRLSALLLPIVGRLPFPWLYPTGAAQLRRVPRFRRWFDWATVIAGDSHYILRTMPGRLDGKVVCVSTTTAEDAERWRTAGVRYLVTTTPRVGERSFGANLLEAALVAAAGADRPLAPQELEVLIERIGLAPELHLLAG